METTEVKLTKKALNKFIQWSTSRYNYYLNFGTKKENVEMVFKALKDGFRNTHKGPETKFQIECSMGNGEGQGYRYWRLKGRAGDFKYEVDCVEKTITGIQTGNKIKFTL